MNSQFRDDFLHFIPTHRRLVSQIDKIAEIMDVWQPTFAEFGLLQALILFRDDKMANFSNPQLISQINQQIRLLHEWLLAKDGKNNAELRRQFFMLLYDDALKAFEDQHDEVIAEAVSTWPSLMRNHKLFVEVYIEPPPATITRDDTMMTP